MEPTHVHHVDAAALHALHERYGQVHPRGRVLYRQGDTSGELYVVLRGSVELFLPDAAAPGGQRAAVVAAPGEYFGELACFGREPRRATAVVREDDTAVLLIDRAAAVDLLTASPRFVLDVIGSLAARLLFLEFENHDLRRLSPAAAAAAAAARPLPSGNHGKEPGHGGL